jgi:hypothetical protein
VGIDVTDGQVHVAHPDADLIRLDQLSQGGCGKEYRHGRDRDLSDCLHRITSLSHVAPSESVNEGAATLPCGAGRRYSTTFK